MPPRKALPAAGREAVLAQVDSLPLRTIDDLQSIGEVFVKSGLFADSRDAAKAMVKILAGRELGLPPFASMTGVNIIQGKPALSAALMGTVIARSGTHRYTVTKMADEEVAISFAEKLDGEWVSCGPDSTFTTKDAMRAGLFSNATYKKYPRNMLYARALSNGAKWYCAGVFGGPVYVPEELGAVTDEDGRVISVDIEQARRPDDYLKPQDLEQTLKDSVAQLDKSDTQPDQVLRDAARSTVADGRVTIEAGDVGAAMKLHDSVADIAAILDKDYRSWRKRDVWTKSFFGEALLDEATMLAFAKREPTKWRSGVALIWEQQG